MKILNLNKSESKTGGYRFTKAQREALALWLLCKSQTELADKIGVSKQQVTAWLKQPHFREAVAELEAMAKASATQGILAVHEEAVGVLQKQLGSGDERVAQEAAKFLLKVIGLPKEKGEREKEFDELIKMMGELRERLAQLERGRRDPPALTLS
jgi:transcriptional regulator with XRE-family HTH domain